MAITLPPAFILEKNKLNWEDALVDLVEIDITIATTLYFAVNPTDIVFNGNTYIAKNIKIGQQQSQLSGGIRAFPLNIESVDQVIHAFIHLNDVRGQEVRLLQVHGALLGDPAAKIEIPMKILSWTSDERSVTFSLGGLRVIGNRFPRRRFTRDQCQFLYGSLLCGYSEVGAMSEWELPTCSKHMEGSNGCRVHGVQEVLDAKPQLHPERFGAYPGLTRGRVRL